jgi:DNA-3-methyladenine glycosylase II
MLLGAIVKLSFRRKTVTEKTFSRALKYLYEKDSELASIIDKYGKPPMWRRKPGFQTLVQIILEQQVSLASAKAVYERLSGMIAPFDSSRFLTLDDDTLHTAGFSWQKMRYCRGLAFAIVEGNLDLNELERMDDETARSKLVQIHGIGTWTADIYLLLALRRPDVWPETDLALVSAVRKLKKLPQIGADELNELSSEWHPWRAVAARLLWHYYLSSKKSG